MDFWMCCTFLRKQDTQPILYYLMFDPLGSCLSSFQLQIILFIFVAVSVFNKSKHILINMEILYLFYLRLTLFAQHWFQKNKTLVTHCTSAAMKLTKRKLKILQSCTFIILHPWFNFAQVTISEGHAFQYPTFWQSKVLNNRSSH